MAVSLVDLENLWKAGGGKAELAAPAAAIADAESGGRDIVGGPNRDGTYDYGRWQINASNFRSLGLTPTTALDPNVNAKAAVQLSGNTVAGFSNWSTWNSYKDMLAGRPLTDSQRQAATTIANDLQQLGSNGQSIWERIWKDLTFQQIEQLDGTTKSTGQAVDDTKTAVTNGVGSAIAKQLGVDPKALQKWWDDRFAGNALNTYGLMVAVLIVAVLLAVSSFGSSTVAVNLQPGGSHA